MLKHFNLKELRNIALLFFSFVLLSSLIGYLTKTQYFCANYATDCKILVIDDQANPSIINKYTNKNYVSYNNVVELLGINSEIKFIIKPKSALTTDELIYAKYLNFDNGIYYYSWNQNNSFYKLEISNELDTPRIYFNKQKVKIYFDSYVYENELNESLYSFVIHHLPEDIKIIFLLLDGVILIQFIVFFSIATFSYYVFWVWFKDYFAKYKIQKNMPRDNAIKVEIAQSAIALFCTSLLSLRVGVMENYQLGLIYDNIADKGVAYYIFSLIAIFLLADAYYYWAHRLMHHKSIYKYTHKIHHNSVRVTPFTTISVNVSELILTSLFIILVLSFLPLHRSVIFIFAATSLLKNIMIHLGYEILPNKLNNTWLSWLVTATHHEIHHMKFQQNYGIYFRFWDVWMGTEDKDYLKKYEQVTSGKPL